MASSGSIQHVISSSSESGQSARPEHVLAFPFVLHRRLLRWHCVRKRNYHLRKVIYLLERSHCASHGRTPLTEFENEDQYHCVPYLDEWHPEERVYIRDEFWLYYYYNCALNNSHYFTHLWASLRLPLSLAFLAIVAICIFLFAPQSPLTTLFALQR
jgi:hypothetical protein